MNTRIKQTRLSTATLTGVAFLSLVSLLFVSAAHANQPISGTSVAGIIDAPLAVAANAAASAQQIKAQVNQEQSELGKMGRGELETRAKNGERLAQVALGSDFADEAQQILYVPAAANSAISDALAWYSLAAQRGFPGSLSLSTSGVKFHPVRVVRNR